MDYDMLNRALAPLIARPIDAERRRGIAAIIEAHGLPGTPGERRRLAYIIATAGHETAWRFLPVRETLADSDDEAIRRLDKAWRGDRLKTVSKPYWHKDSQGRAWFGRGFVQLTHRDNYRRLARRIDIDLVAMPQLALATAVAAEIIVIGMNEGLFTGLALPAFLNETRADWEGARQVVNGMDRAADIARVARAVLKAL